MRERNYDTIVGWIAFLLAACCIAWACVAGR